ncbi:MAG: lipid-binding SYLF domain-containing protein [Woeseiaceae bacterium]
MRLRQYTLVVVLSILTSFQAFAETKEENRIANATDVVSQLLRIPEQSVPPALLSRAYGVAVLPNVVKVGFGLGARRGKGLLVVRQDDGGWSNPTFVTLTGGSVGFQVGAQSTDIILVFKSRKSVDGITGGKLTLGADASLAAGPVGRHTSAATDLKFKAEVYSYARSRGLFLGIALEGAGVTMDRKANAAFYGAANVTPEQIFASGGNAAPQSANNFVQMLTAQTRRLPAGPGTSAQSRDPARSELQQPREQRESEVRTYGMNNSDPYE